MKRITTAIIISVLVISGCTMIAQNDKTTTTGESGSKSGSSEIADESSSDSGFAEEIEHSFSNMYPNSDLYLEADLENGKFYEIPRLTKEEDEVFIQSGNCVGSIRARLGSYGVFLNPDIIAKDNFASNVEYSFLPMFISRYKDFDFIYIQYHGYRGTFSGNLYIFQNSLLKEYTTNIGEIDLDNCFRTTEENIWFVRTIHAGGSGLAMEEREWMNLTNSDIPVELKYMNYYATGNCSAGHDIDVYLIIVYRALEEELYINEQGIPVLKVSWQKEVFDDDEIVLLTATGYDEYAIDASMDWEHYDPYDLSCGDLLEGLEEQLNELINNGTEEEKHIAKQLMDNFSTVPIS